MARKYNRVELKLSDFAVDFKEQAISLAKASGIATIRDVQAIEYAGASPGKVILQFSPTHPGRLLIGHHRIDWEWTNRLVASQPQLKIKKLETYARRRG